MKKVLFFLGAILLGMYSCTNEVFDVKSSRLEVVSKTNDRFLIDESEAINIANRFFKNTTRSSHSGLSIKYVTSKNIVSTRSESNRSDTIAYIFNRGDNEGFIVISSDNRVFPILAFSDTGTFMYKEEMSDVVYANFISRIDNHLRSVENSDSIVEIPDDFFTGCKFTNPVVSDSWSQIAPFNKYVNRDYPNSLVGCVAISIAQAMVHCKDSIAYKEQISKKISVPKTYNLKMIRDALADSLSNDSIYDVAIDEAAKLVYQIGVNVRMQYSDTLSGTDYRYMLPFLSGLKFILRSSDYKKYNEDCHDILNCLLNDDIICMVGAGGPLGDRSRHAWVIDGCRFCWTEPFPPHKEVQEVFLHCNWGWGGQCNGYYSGYYFMTDADIYYTAFMEYFAVGKNEELEDRLFGNTGIHIKP